MSLFAVLFALLIEQLKPLPRENWFLESLTVWMRWVERSFNAGHNHHSSIVWSIAVVAPSVLVGFIFLFLAHNSLFLSVAWSIVILYLTLSFRQFSYFFTKIRDALESSDESAARESFSKWRNQDASDIPQEELLKLVIEHSLLAAHRQVFGVLFWFVLLAVLGLGPAGAIFYQLANWAKSFWTNEAHPSNTHAPECLMAVAQQTFNWIDFLPARLTAFGFAVVGNFEESITVWRRDATLWRQLNEGTILAAAAGAMGVCLGGAYSPIPGYKIMDPDYPPLEGDDFEGSSLSGSTTGALPSVAHLRSLVGLVWRSLVLWLLLLALLTIANLMG